MSIETISNEGRGERAQNALDYYSEHYLKTPAEPLDTVITDFLTDLRHLCSSDPEVKFDACLRMSERHFKEEKGEQKELVSESVLFSQMDGAEFKAQRSLVTKILSNRNTALSEDELELLEGLQNLLDNIADVAHDCYGINCLFSIAEETSQELEKSCDCALEGCCEKLAHHEGHELDVIIYGNDSNAAIECNDCNEVLIDFDNDGGPGFQSVADHYGHELEVIAYTDRVTVECLTCNEVIVVAKTAGGGHA